MDKEYWKLKKREQRAKARLGEDFKVTSAKVSLEPSDYSVVNVQSVERPEEIVTFALPEGYNKKMWEYACERALRARRYARKMPEHIRPNDVRFQDPEWQYQDQTKYPLPSGLLRD